MESALQVLVNAKLLSVETRRKIALKNVMTEILEAMTAAVLLAKLNAVGNALLKERNV